MRWTRCIRLTRTLDAEHRPAGCCCGVEFVGMVGQEQDLVRCQADRLGNRFVREAFTLGTGVGQIEPTADQRRQITTVSVGEPILLVADRTRGVDVQLDTRITPSCQRVRYVVEEFAMQCTAAKACSANQALRGLQRRGFDIGIEPTAEYFRYFGRSDVWLRRYFTGLSDHRIGGTAGIVSQPLSQMLAGVTVETLTHRTGGAGGALDVDDDRCDLVATS